MAIRTPCDLSHRGSPRQAPPAPFYLVIQVYINKPEKAPVLFTIIQHTSDSEFLDQVCCFLVPSLEAQFWTLIWAPAALKQLHASTSRRRH